jgi:pimeloyl-ACP methyl ester carboxylesterase
LAVRSYLEGAVVADRIDGVGPPLLALHGWGRSRHDLAGVVRGRDALVPDLPGFGSSPPPPSPWGARDYAQFIAGVLEADAAGPYLVVGHSFGGRVAACLGAARPDLVSGIVEVGAPLVRLKPVKTPSVAYRLVRFANRVGLVSDRRMERLRYRRGSADYRAASGVMRQVLVKTVGEDYTEQLKSLACPVAFCWGELDTEAPPEVAQRAAGLVSQMASYEVLLGAGHDIHLTHADAVKRAIASVEKALSCR